MADTKACSKCSRVLPATAFARLGRGDRTRPDCRECCSAWQRAHYAVSRAVVRARQARYFAENRVRLGQASRAWRRLNREAMAVAFGRERARRWGVAATLRVAEWRGILALFAGHCAYCGRVAPLTMDHMVAMANGGSHAAENVVPACRPCNSRKGQMSLLAFLRDVRVAA